MNDLINGLFECSAVISILNHCRVMYKAKTSEGISIVSTAFFCAWGCWNMHYYPSLSQSLSFYASVFVTISNALWIGLMIYYRRKND